MLRLTTDEAKTLKRAADRSGLSAADYVRQVIRKETTIMRIPVWVCLVHQADPGRVFREGGGPFYLLEPRRDITGTERVFRLLSVYGHEIEDHALIGADWFRAPEKFRFVLRGSPKPWELVAMMDREVTLRVTNYEP